MKKKVEMVDHLYRCKRCDEWRPIRTIGIPVYVRCPKCGKPMKKVTMVQTMLKI